MTVVEEQIQPAPAPVKMKSAVIPTSLSASFTRFTVVGTELGIEIDGEDLHAVIAAARPAGVTIVSKFKIAGFRTRPGKEWGSEFHHWLKEQGVKHLSAVVALPRREAIVRVVAVPGVKTKDIGSALAYQVDALHPYGDEEVYHGWMSAGVGSVAVGIVRASILDGYAASFQEAGVPVAGFTFSAAAIYAALRLYGTVPRNFVAWREDDHGAVEVYGESDARPVFSAEFEMPPSRALLLARAELRLDGEPKPLAAMLPQPRNVVVAPPLAYAVALAAIGNWRLPYANLLPVARRIVRSRARYVPTLILALALISTGLALAAYQQIRQQQYLDALSAEIAKIQPRAMRADSLDKRTEEHRARIRILDDYRRRTRDDADVLLELSRLLPPPVWVQTIDILGDTVTISGEADQAAPLLKVLDASPLFRNSEFQMGVVRLKESEQFRIRTQRRPHK
jgi:Tfp pilus assembly protein PilN